MPCFFQWFDKLSQVYSRSWPQFNLHYVRNWHWLDSMYLSSLLVLCIIGVYRKPTLIWEAKGRIRCWNTGALRHGRFCAFHKLYCFAGFTRPCQVRCKRHDPTWSFPLRLIVIHWVISVSEINYSCSSHLCYSKCFAVYLLCTAQLSGLRLLPKLIFC